MIHDTALGVTIAIGGGGGPQNNARGNLTLNLDAAWIVCASREEALVVDPRRSPRPVSLCGWSSASIHHFLCGNAAVLVDLHVLPLGPAREMEEEEETSWFTAAHAEEVTALVQDAVESRVRQHAETLRGQSRSRGPAKHRKELPPATMFSATATHMHGFEELLALVQKSLWQHAAAAGAAAGGAGGGGGGRGVDRFVTGSS
ncbi:hypothetical protein CRUP_002897 [Coryphaenoides rupestris]|nr:hypothetical protein CRUP_002897 [Coryphaenoides rupestris]